MGNKYYCKPCGATMFRVGSDTNDKCSNCYKPALLITDENWKDGISRNEIWSVYCKQCQEEETLMPAIEDFKCENCGYTGYGQTVNRPSIGRFSEKFPYFDRGLDMWLTSKAHRREVMKEKGLIEASGDWSVSDMQDRDALNEAKQDKQILDKLQRDMKESPAFAEYRQRKDDINFKHKPRE